MSRLPTGTLTFLFTDVDSGSRLWEHHPDAMRAALERYLPAGCRWNAPSGGMFFWVELPEGLL